MQLKAMRDNNNKKSHCSAHIVWFGRIRSETNSKASWGCCITKHIRLEDWNDSCIFLYILKAILSGLACTIWLYQGRKSPRWICGLIFFWPWSFSQKSSFNNAIEEAEAHRKWLSVVWLASARAMMDFLCKVFHFGYSPFLNTAHLGQQLWFQTQC